MMPDLHTAPDLGTKLDRPFDPHVAPLNRAVERWRTDAGSDAGTNASTDASTDGSTGVGTNTDGARRFIPWFDPDDGGVAARVLVLFESPSPSTIASDTEAISSEDNASASNRGFVSARERSGIARTDIVRWNVAPWAVVDCDGRKRQVTIDDLDTARPTLHELLVSLPNLAGIVTLGNWALTGVTRYMTLANDPVVVPVLAAPHPSPANGHRRTETQVRIENALARAAR
jgi:uracil-DNA glycosylase